MEAVITFPLFAFFVIAIIQFAMWYFAQEIAQASAQQGARAGARYQSSAAAGVDQAWAFIRQTGNERLFSPQVYATGSDRRQVTITVSGTSPSVLPLFGGLPVIAKVEMPIEQLTSGNSW